jgi:hypothetical protein
VTLCVIPTCRTQDDAEPGAYACSTCRTHLVRQLGEIETYLTIVSAVPGRSGDPGPIGRQFSSRPPLRLDVVAMLDPRTEINGASGAVYDGGVEDDVLDEIPNIGADLGGWVCMLYEQHPDWAGAEWDGEVIAYGDGAALLRSRCDWICRQPWVDEFADGIARVHGALRQVNGDAPDRPFADCPEVVDGRVCGGPVSKHGDGLGAQCRTCRTSWRRDQLLDLLEHVAAVKAG